MQYGLCSLVPGDWRSAVIQKNEYKNYRGISRQSVVRKIYAWILADRVRRVTEGLVDDEQGSLGLERGCVGQIFTLKKIGEKEREKKHKEHVCMIGLIRSLMAGAENV